MTFLLERSHPEDEALVGDVLEEVDSGRSRAWAWRQTMHAVVEGRWRSLRRDTHHALQDVLVGGALLLLLSFGVVVAADLLQRVLPMSNATSLDGVGGLAALVGAVLLAGVLGYVLPAVHRTHPGLTIPMVGVGIPLIALGKVLLLGRSELSMWLPDLARQGVEAMLLIVGLAVGVVLAQVSRAGSSRRIDVV